MRFLLLKPTVVLSKLKALWLFSHMLTLVLSVCDCSVKTLGILPSAVLELLVKHEEFVLVSWCHGAWAVPYDHTLNANESFSSCQGWATSNTSRSPSQTGIRNWSDFTVSTFADVYSTISVFDLLHQTNSSSTAASNTPAAISRPITRERTPVC